MNPWYEQVERFAVKTERFDASKRFTDGRVGSIANRGVDLGAEKMAALIWGLEHDNAVVRRCCLEFLDQHPSEQATAAIVGCLDDPVPRVRWHAVHALLCDECKPGMSYVTDDVLNQVRRIADSAPSEKVRAQANYGLKRMAEAG